MAVDLKNHPGRNPDYFKQMEDRVDALDMTRKGFPVRVPPQPNKYIPHIGAKQRAKADVSRVLTPEVLANVIGKEFSSPRIDLHPDRAKEKATRLETIKANG